MARIQGLTLIRDEWPLALLSINHALLHHVDQLLCAVQVSADATLEGVQQLRGFWGERLTVVEIRTPAYLQEAIVATLVRQLAEAAAPDDWLYVFDADEFAVTPSAVPLREQVVVQGIDSPELRYQVWNWVAPVDFDDLDLAAYERVRHRALPSVFLSLPPHILAEEIGRGFLNYFDLPFYDKGLFRFDALGKRWLGPGAHRLRPPAAPLGPSAHLPTEAFHAMHLPLLSRRRLDGRLTQARNLKAQGFPFHHGWQSRMLLDLEASQELDAFWQRHAIDPEQPLGAPGTPCCEESDLFATALEPALALTRSLLDAPTAPDPPLPLAEEACLRMIHQLQDQLNDLHRDLMRHGVNQVAAQWYGSSPPAGPP
ncbi:MAG: glycosyltransferase family 2 protein [Synechococcaceae cyanobacterium]